MRSVLRWPERVTVSDWVDQTIVLDVNSAEPGNYHTDRTPYVREWQDSAALPWVHQVTIVASTQVGKTQSLLNVLAWAFAQDPGPITWVMPTREDAAEFGENRVQPMVEVSPVLRRQLTGDRFDAKKRQIRFKRCRLLFRSSRVPKELAQYPARWLFGDEACKWPQWTQNEAAPFDLARERTRTFWNHKVYLSSTPTVPRGLISQEFARGDRRRYWVPCPHCGKHQSLRWSQVKWDKELDTEEKMRDERRAWYECEHCQQRIEDRHKQPMLAGGFWCPEGVDPSGRLVGGRLVLENDRTPHRSYHIWAGYSPWLAWWEIVAEWLRSKDQPATLQNFVNSWLGEDWVEQVEAPRPEMLRECIGGYQRGEVPEGVQVITVGVDVQKRFLVYVVRGWGLDMESWLLDHGRIDNFEQLEAEVLARPWPRGLMVRGLFLDSNYRTAETVDFARKYPAVVRLLVGDEWDDPRPFSARRIDRHPRTGQPIGTLMVWQVNVGLFKDEVSQSMNVGGQAAANGFHVYADIDEDYCREVTSEHKIVVRTGEKERERWVPRHGRRQNHYWDAEVYNRALARMLNVHQLRAFAERSGARRPQRPANRGARASQATGFGGASL